MTKRKRILNIDRSIKNTAAGLLEAISSPYRQDTDYLRDYVDILVNLMDERGAEE